LGFSPDGRLLASAEGHPQVGRTGAVHLWDARTGDWVARFAHTGPVWAVAFSPDGRLLASAGEDRVIRLWDRRTMKPASILVGHEGIITSLAFSPDGRLASGSYDRSVRIWDTGTARQTRVLIGHEDPVWSLAFSPDGRNLASTCSDGTLIIWE